MTQGGWEGRKEPITLRGDENEHEKQITLHHYIVMLFHEFLVSHFQETGVIHCSKMTTHTWSEAQKLLEYNISPQTVQTAAFHSQLLRDNIINTALNY